MTGTVTVNDVLDGQVALDLECLDRIYLNDDVPNLQVSEQVVRLSGQAPEEPDTDPGNLREDRHRVPRGQVAVRRG